MENGTEPKGLNVETRRRGGAEKDLFGGWLGRPSPPSWPRLYSLCGWGKSHQALVAFAPPKCCFSWSKAARYVLAKNAAISLSFSLAQSKRTAPSAKVRLSSVIGNSRNVGT